MAYGVFVSNVKIKRGQFVINGQRRPYKTMTSFCLMSLYQNRRRGDARRWLDRLKEMGFDGPRLFGETWPEDETSVFFGNPQWTPVARIVDEHQPPNSRLKLLSRYPTWVEKLTEDLEERDMIAEFCVIATLKNWEGAGHILNRAAQMFHGMFDAENCPYIFETINEADAYVHPDITPDEVARMGYRWLRNEGGDHTNFPGSLVGVSAGGNYEPPWDDSGYTHRNLHLPRGRNWHLGDNGMRIKDWLPIAQAKAGRRPLALNETIHYIDRDEWDGWIGVAPKWAGLSTKNAKQVYEYHQDVLSTGTSTCVHTRVGMSTDPSEPFTRLEQMYLSENRQPEPPPKLPEPPQPGPPPDPSRGLFDLIVDFWKWIAGLF